MAEQNKKGTKDSPPGPPLGEGVVRSPSPEEQDPETPGCPSQERRLPWRFTGLAGQRRAAPLSCGQLHAVAVVKAAAEAELERRWRPQEGALGDEQTEGLQPAVGWRQQRTAGAGYVETPPSAAVRRRTVGQSPPPLRRTGRPGRSGRLRNEVCQTPSYPPRSAIGGTPGAPTWTSSDPGPAPSLCAVPAIQLGQHHPRATALTPWPGGLAEGP